MVAVQLHYVFTYKLLKDYIFYLFCKEVRMIWGVTKIVIACIAINKKNNQISILYCSNPILRKLNTTISFFGTIFI